MRKTGVGCATNATACIGGLIVISDVYLDARVIRFNRLTESSWATLEVLRDVKLRVARRSVDLPGIKGTPFQAFVQ